MIPYLLAALAEVGSATSLGKYLLALSQAVANVSAKSSVILTYTLDDVALDTALLGVPKSFTMGTITQHAILLGLRYTVINDAASVGSLSADSLTVAGAGQLGFPLPGPMTPGNAEEITLPLGFVEAMPGDTVDTIVTRTVGVLAPGTTVRVDLYATPVFP